MQLTLSNIYVSISDRGATVDFLGGSLWLRPDAAKSLRTGPYSSLVLAVRLRSVGSGDRRYTAIFVDSVVSASSK